MTAHSSTSAGPPPTRLEIIVAIGHLEDALVIFAPFLAPPADPNVVEYVAIVHERLAVHRAQVAAMPSPPAN